jgi:hypothetical protein
MTLNPNPRLHKMIVERPVHVRGPRRKAQVDPCAEGLAGKRVAISESLPSSDHGGEVLF